MVLGFVGDVTAVGQNVVDSHVGNASASLQYLEVARLPLLVVALYHDPCESNEFCYEVNKRRVKVVMLVGGVQKSRQEDIRLENLGQVHYPTCS
jgi:hypothetical protein